MTVERIDGGIYRLLVPFESVYTTVYVSKYGDGAAIVDCATYDTDVDGYIIPALRHIGINEKEVRYILLTHRHSDHAGGLFRLRELLPTAKVCAYSDPEDTELAAIRDGDVFLGGLMAVHLPGHTKDSTAFLDLETSTLLSGDCLQLAGIGRYRSGVRYPELYQSSVERLMGMEISRIVAAHEFDPLGSIAQGKDKVREYLCECLACMPQYK